MEKLSQHSLATSSSFDGELRNVAGSLRAALIDALVAVETDASRPTTIAKRLGLDKNLAWRIARIANAPDPYSASQHVPGDVGIDIVVRGLERGGASKILVERVRAAFRAFRKTIKEHLDDRATFELALDNLGRGTDGEKLELSRKLAFRGNSGIWGVQARIRVSTAFVAPSADSTDSLDSILAGGWVDFRRIRAGAPWALFRVRAYQDDGTPLEMSNPLDSSGSGKSLLIREFCTATMPEIRPVQEGSDLVYELGDGPMGNAGAFTCFYGSLRRGIGSKYRDAANWRGEYSTMISAPVETLLFDLVFHKDLAELVVPKVEVFGRLTPDPRSRSDRDKLPISERIHDIGGGPPVFSTPLMPRYTELVDYVFSRLGWNSQDFLARRFVLSYPPFPSTVVIGFPLLERPLPQPG